MKNGFFRNVFAIIIILVGIALVLTNVGVVSWEFAESWIYIYPAFFVLLGLKWCWDGIRGNGGLYLGSFLVIFGGLLLADRFDLLDFTFGDIFKLWPLLFIYLGFSIFGSSNKRKKKKKFQVIFDSDDYKKRNKAYDNKQTMSQKFAVGNHSFNTQNWKVEPMQLWNAVGDYHIDFTKAFIPDNEIPISIEGWVGDIRILMPENVEFTVDAHVKTGDINVFGERAGGVGRSLTYVTPNYEDATRKLTLYLDLKVGDIRIDKV